ncbi:hypothetical protein HPG69_009406 [Diceros bicornis minor]|uniref:Ig-like domain-containing protein n=1 Tax=Diceros bicornis minor TaxID=77932 RepID=A0A7J7F3X6_DICBM|nr:hypothetical protein HPG69_009406 [Diceros bicornis minor]
MEDITLRATFVNYNTNIPKNLLYDGKLNQDFKTLPPRLKEMKSQESVAGSKLVLRCETSSEYSSLRFKWFKNGNELNRKNKPQNIKIQKKPGKSELRINKASLADSGEYMCKVISKLGNDSASANITIVDSNGAFFALRGLEYILRSLLACLSQLKQHMCLQSLPLEYQYQQKEQILLHTISASEDRVHVLSSALIEGQCIKFGSRMCVLMPSATPEADTQLFGASIPKLLSSHIKSAVKE